MTRITYWEKLKLQIDNLEMMHKQHEEGLNVSTSVYWQNETIIEMLKSFEGAVGADVVRDEYEEDI